ncbi:MAG: ABC transporter ATP-binding protein [Hoeflea sp.]|uniref:ABC transporter ATP-binding protein n=1 Tax=Hoeflea sp. TaxID=1940281 RepID=UPI001E0A2D45|nr:ABC transporter ATP-binding protein [Hoeflea sp.]MBU4529591.1 ABC transporter ATP-binding protein [Alphaproteobacteria bacterium]MBU4546710.1 ABC transporter ATP-binding protein [Alphaproteobacteria bacterium]MBU4550978.1 ABC transporter ATP-binding protein [Alphaproteobacteria bacterium]MBV1723920.1 ABC transporter ATP-binding protein [Hoeflea sp.]MBV1763197.1 ABC transporter ATP-binding protein [Hoeflea sp.]
MSKGTAIGVETLHMTKRFGDFTALDDVSIKITPGSFHALLGENGAGKSTLVKCMMGFYQPTSGQMLINDREAEIRNPRDAHASGLGMVYQHFTLVPSLTAAENLVIARENAPAVIDWRKEREGLQAFLKTMPFSVALDQPVNRLAAGEKQKLELLKQLYLGRHFLILDEPTSVLTPSEADELLGMVRDLTQAGALTCLMITHKFREVTAFADVVSVLRRGAHVGGGKVSELSHDDMAAMMIGDKTLTRSADRSGEKGEAVLTLDGISASDRSGLKTIEVESLRVSAGEVVGIAGVSGNGQMELMEVLTGQRPVSRGRVNVKSEAFHGTRRQARDLKVRFLPEEPLQNASAGRMSVAENLAFRTFDLKKNGGLNGKSTRTWLDRAGMSRLAVELVDAFKVKTASIESPIASLSGGNVQRAVLARELSDEVDLLIIANPCFGLDFSAVAEIRARIMAARNAGAAVLLISEDLDEILELSDRVLVMSEGRIAYETPIATLDVGELGRHMAGHA